MSKVTLFGHVGTPNPPKVAILLEELGIEYDVVEKAFGDSPDGIKHANFTKYNPNGRVPAIIDHINGDKVVWESGAILLYLAEQFDKSGRLSGVNVEERADVLEWLFFQVSGQGPMQGQMFWFLYLHPVKDIDPSVVERYRNETRRIYGVIDKHLENKEWFALNRFTIADIAFYPWTNGLERSGILFSEFPNVEAWYNRMKALPSVKKAYANPKVAVPPATA